MSDDTRTPLLHPRGWRVVSAILVVGVVAALGYLALWTEDPRVRYAHLQCGYDQIYRTGGPIDVLFLGSSRTKFGIDPYAVARAIDRVPETTTIVNMGRPGSGPGQLYRQLLDTERERGVAGPIIVEYAPTDAPVFGRELPYYHYLPTYPATTTFRGLLEDWHSKPREPAYAKARDLLGQVRYKMDVGIETALLGREEGNRYRRPERRAAGGVQTCVRNPQVPEEQLKRNPIVTDLLRERERSVARRVGPNGTWRDLPNLRWNIDGVLQDRQSHYIDEIIRFGEERGLPVYAIVVPGYLEPQPDPGSAAQFEERFGIPLLSPPLELRETLNADKGYYYRDRNHLNRRGWTLYTDWLVEEMRAAGWDPPAAT